jgi:hypothetical protein
MREVNQLHDAVNHRVTEGDQGIDAAKADSIYDVLDELFQPLALLRKLKRNDGVGSKAVKKKRPVSGAPIQTKM